MTKQELLNLLKLLSERKENIKVTKDYTIVLVAIIFLCGCLAGGICVLAACAWGML
jgi:hypothetical protein